MVSRSTHSRFWWRRSEGRPEVGSRCRAKERNRRHGQQRAGRQHDGAFDGVLQLPHVPGPLVPAQRLDDPVFDPVDVLPGTLAVLFQEVLDQHGNVVAPSRSGGISIGMTFRR